jgi:Transcriptional regulator PadR-like family
MDELRWDGLVTFESRIDDAVVGALQSQNLSGFEIWRRLGSKEGASGPLTEALLYPTLYHLEAEGLLQSDWHEGERTRRKYRLKATASMPASRGDQGVPAAAHPADRRAVSPNPEAGSWFVPPKEVPVAAPASPVAPPTAADSSSANIQVDQPDWAALAAYADNLGARLDLPRAEQSRVRQEIADHLQDSAHALARQGYGSEAAATEALGRLGPSPDLAHLIERAQHTPVRLKRGIRRGVLEIVGEMAVWLGLSVGVFVVAPGVAGVVMGLGRLAGLHLVVLRSAEWTTNQMAVTLCIGAFAAGRISLGRLARISRRSEATLRKRWALGGAAALLTVILVLPGYEDAVTVATLLAVPIAFVAGTFRPQQFRERAYSLRGVATGALVVAAAALLPFVRLFDYDPNGTPGTPLGQGGAVQFGVSQDANGSLSYSLPAGAEAAMVELWPAATDGAFIVVDRSAGGPAISVAPGSAIDPTKLPPGRMWWVAAVVTNADGTRTALAVAIQTNAPPSSPSTALGWLISRL